MIKVTVSRTTGSDEFSEQLVLTVFEDGADRGAWALGAEGSEQLAQALRAAGITVYDLRHTTEDVVEGETDV